MTMRGITGNGKRKGATLEIRKMQGEVYGR